MRHPIQPGCVVRFAAIKSPDMLVEETFDDNNPRGPRGRCLWFTNGTVMRDIFFLDDLKVVKPANFK